MTPEPHSDPGVRLDRDGPVATVTLGRPEVRNAQTPQLWSRLVDISRELTADVRVVVVRGEGPDFSAGLDRSVARSLAAELAAMPEAPAAERVAGFQRAFAWLHRPDLVSVAAVQGAAIGAGCQLALACDLRVLAAGARLALPEVSLGLVPDLGGAARLVGLIGYARALEIILTGRRVDAEEAARLGLANLVVPAADLDGAVADLVAALLDSPREAVIEAKALLSSVATGAGAAAGGGPDPDRAAREAQVRLVRDGAGRR